MAVPDLLGEAQSRCQTGGARAPPIRPARVTRPMELREARLFLLSVRSTAMTGQELHDYAADHISYELTMLYETAMRLRHEKAIDTDWIPKNAFIESFAIHARALALFLYKSRRLPGDVTAEQYVKDVAAWKAVRGDIPPGLQEVIDRTGKEIAHLTTGRHPAGDPKKGWSVEHVYRMFFGPLHLFLKHAEAARLDMSVMAFISAMPTPPAGPAPAPYGYTSSDRGGVRTDVSTP